MNEELSVPPTVQDALEHEIYMMLMEAKDYREKLATSKTSTKRKYYEKKLQQLNPVVDRAIAIYDVYKHRKQEDLKKKEATVVEGSVIEENAMSVLTGE